MLYSYRLPLHGGRDLNIPLPADFYISVIIAIVCVYAAKWRSLNKTTLGLTERK